MSNPPEPTPNLNPAAWPNWPGETLEAAIRAARLADPQIEGPDRRVHVVLPPGFSTRELPDDARLAPWPKQSVTVDDRASLTAYANRFRDHRSVIVADYDALKITARLDYHSASMEGCQWSETGPNGHSVTLALRLAEEFARWNAIEGKLLPQDEFAAFIEENSVDIGYPEAAVMIEISRDLEATVGQTFKSSVRLENGDRAMRFETESKVTNNVQIPDKFLLHIPIYNGEEPTDLAAKFRWRASGQGSLLLGFQWHRVEYQRRAHFAQIATTAAEETGLPVFMGRLA